MASANAHMNLYLDSKSLVWHHIEYARMISHQADENLRPFFVDLLIPLMFLIVRGERVQRPQEAVANAYINLYTWSPVSWIRHQINYFRYSSYPVYVPRCKRWRVRRSQEAVANA